MHSQRDIAQEIIAAGLWCTVEICVDVPGQVWEPRLVICRKDADEVLDDVEGWIRDMPAQDARLAGYTRGTLRRVDAAPAALCHVAEASAAKAMN